MNIVTQTDLSLFETSKTERQEFAQAVINNAKEGLLNPLKLHLQVKCLEDLIKQITCHPSYRELTLDEAYKYGKSFEHYNAKFEIKEMGVKYDYSVCNDPVYNNLKIELEALQEKIKAREMVLKSISSQGLQTLIEDEVVTLYPPNKTSTTSISVNLK
jgi:hypothetical protein